MIDLFDISKAEQSGADFSDDRKYRNRLWRIWDEKLPKPMVIMLNPSTANGLEDDPTIRNLRVALKVLGYGGFIVVNCFTVISSDPRILQKEDINDGNNTDNQYIIGDTAKECDIVIFAWGNFKIVPEKEIDKRWIGMFPGAKCFGKNKNGSPFHPMALMYKGLIKNPQLINYI